MTAHASDRPSMTLHFHSATKTDDPFQKGSLYPFPPLESAPTRNTCGPRNRSGTSSSIAAWAAQVQPGSPAPISPRSPRRHLSLRKIRCPSITSIRVPSASFLHIAPTPSVPVCNTDLTTVGYTSVFLHLPNTPITATLPLVIKPSSSSAAKNILIPPVPSPTCKSRGLTRFRSFSALRFRGRSKSHCPNSPAKMKAKVAASVKCKKAKYAARPPPLVNELALMQFADGGSMDNNIRRVMEAQAKATGVVGIADVYRDDRNGIWWDQDEEWEYAHLLSEGDESRPRVVGDLQWVTFGDNTASMPEEERRGSLLTQDSDLDPKYIVQPNGALDGDDLAPFGSTTVPLATHKPAMSILSLPSRSRRAATHLRKPDFSVDVAFSGPHALSKHSKSSTSAFKTLGTGMPNPKGKARRRPAPLKLAPPGPALKRPTNSPIDADKLRKDFIEASFEPAVSNPATPATAVPLTAGRRVGSSDRAINVPRRIVNEGLTNRRMKTRPSMLSMIGLFRSARKQHVAC